jgi:uncharacterized protein YndB with AHSA1/START domain
VNDSTKAVRKLELEVDVDAPLEAAWKALTEGPGIASWFAPISEVSGPGPGATIRNGWSAEMMMTGTVGAWEPMKHVSWLDESGWTGPGTSMAVDYHLCTEKGKTRVRLVQSAFGESDAWDDLFEGTKVGWTYFLYNLRMYLEKHQGRTRRMISTRLPVDMPRASFWKHLLSDAAGFVAGGTGAVGLGKRIETRLSDKGTTPALAEVVIEGRGLGLRFPELGEALLFIELEGVGDAFHVGYWLSVYDPELAKRLEAPALRAFSRIHESAPKG